MKISLAPLQGYTEFPFRNALHETIGGIDEFYTPFLRFENDGSLRSKHLNDIKPANNNGLKLIPQILVNSSDSFLKLTKLIKENGYTEINWNLGCPYPMVAKRKLGSGLLAFPDLIKNILDDVINKTNLDITIKLRSGYQNSNDILAVIAVLNQFPIKEIIYHPRIGKQLYKGSADAEKFTEIEKISKIPLAYNGDIDSTDKFHKLIESNNSINHVMIGRGLLTNPFLAREIKGDTINSNEKRQLFSNFHNDLYKHYKHTLSGDSHLLNKMVHFWEYFSHLFTQQKKVYKTLKKSKTIYDFEANVKKVTELNEMK